MDKKRLYRVWFIDQWHDEHDYILASKFNLVDKNQWYRIEEWIKHDLSNFDSVRFDSILTIQLLKPDGKI